MQSRRGERRNKYMENETLDLEKEHQFHSEYTEHCSTCWSEARLINAKKTVDSRWEDLYPDNSRNQHALSHLDDFLLNRDDKS